MRMLLVESHPGSARALGDQLSLAGHEITSCCDEQSLSPCRNVEHGEDCPLERHVDVAIIAKSATSPRSLFEMGGVCAERHRVPVIEIDETDCGDIGAMLSTVQQVATARTEEAYAEAVRSALGRPELAVDVERSERRVRVVIHLAEPADSNAESPFADSAARSSIADSAARSSIADSARSAVRRYDPFVPVIDVSLAG